MPMQVPVVSPGAENIPVIEYLGAGMQQLGFFFSDPKFKPTLSRLHPGRWQVVNYAFSSVLWSMFAYFAFAGGWGEQLFPGETVISDSWFLD